MNIISTESNVLVGIIKNTSLIIPFFLVLTAILYYGQYYNYGFNHADEGNIALVAQRILIGNIPLVDFDFNAGVLWPYSIALVFWLFGINFIYMKLYFFALAILTALFAYATVLSLTSRQWLAFITALVLILIPGVLHKIYIPLMVVANMYFLSRINIYQNPLNYKHVLISVIVLALTFLIRGDLGIVALVVFLGLLAANTLFGTRQLKLKILSSAYTIIYSTVVFAIAILPFYILAYIYNYQHSLSKKMFGKLNHLLWILQQRFQTESLSSETVAANASESAGQLLGRIPIENIWTSNTIQPWAILTYLPVLILCFILVSLVICTIYCFFKSKPTLIVPYVSLLTLFALSLGVFPQFFLWRPDVSHLSQFMPGYIVLLFVIIGHLLPRQTAIIDDSPLSKNIYSIKMTLFKLTIISVLSFNIIYYLWSGINHEYTGSIGIKNGKTQLFKAENGVQVFLRPEVKTEYSQIMEIIDKYTMPREWLLCFPYAPGFNFMSNRMTYMWQHYVDDSWGLSWQTNTIQQMALNKPAIIIVDNWAVNGTEISRFPNWANLVMKYLDQNYTLIDNVLNKMVYILNERHFQVSN